MKITGKRRSLETCTEAGWDAVDFLTDEPVNDQWIDKIGKLKGTFIYLRMLKKPFFKLECGEYVIKGVKGDLFFRMAYPRSEENGVYEVENYLNGETL